MSVAAVMLVKDEADIIEHTIRHLLGQVDEIFVSDNDSTDGTRAILEALQRDDDSEAYASRLRILDDPEIGYFQSHKTTELAQIALQRGHSWVIPCDADEFWYANDGRTFREFLAGVSPDVQIVQAELYNHLPSALDQRASCEHCSNTGQDPDPPRVGSLAAALDVLACPVCKGEVEPNPFKRIGWRQRERAPLSKVACRLRPDLIIEAGNHGASTQGTGARSSGFVVRHFSWRSEAQYVRKIRNGAAAYAETDLPEAIGAHWRMFAGAPDEQIAEHFRTWFHTPDPAADATLIYDPAPWRAEEA